MISNELKELAKKASVTRNGNKVRDSITFRLQANRRLTVAEVSEIQTHLGYDPRGYDLYAFDCKQSNPGEFQIRWACQGSCD